MPLFIDESGNTGPVRSPVDRRFFLAGVRLPTIAHATAFTDDANALRKSLGLKESFEFKFTSTGQHPQRRRAFFDLAMRHPFRFAVGWVDKRLDGLAGNATAIHWAVAVDLAASFRDTLLSHYPPPPPGTKGHQPPKERVWVDDNEDADFLSLVRDLFRELGGFEVPSRQVVGQVKFANSTPSPLLQLADMVCGAYRAFVEDGEAEWYQMIRQRDLNRPPPSGPQP